MNIYVGNLPFALTEDELRETFATFGDVTSAKIITDRFTGKSRGFGFVEMGSKDDGMRAIEGAGQLSLHGKKIIANEARPREKTFGGGGGGGGGGDRGGRRDGGHRGGNSRGGYNAW